MILIMVEIKLTSEASMLIVKCLLLLFLSDIKT